MARRRKTALSARERRKIPRMSNVTIGTHVSRPVEALPSRDLATHGFSNPRKAKRARKGMVDHIRPETLSGESRSDFAKRVNKLHFTESIQRKARAKSAFFSVSIAVLAAAVAVGVGVIAYAGAVSSKMGLGDSNAREALVAPKESEPYYVLIAAEFFEPGREDIGPNLLMLLRIDEANQKAALLNIPPNLQMRLSDGEYHRICEAQLLAGDAELVRAVSELVGVPISHFAKTNREGFIRLVDKLGGITVDVPEEVDDPRVGSVYLPAGRQKLSGEEALILSRATNYMSGEELRAENQCRLAAALIQEIVDTSRVSLILALDDLAAEVSTSYPATGFLSLVNSFRGFNTLNIKMAVVPGYSQTSTSSGIKYYVVREVAWANMKDLFISGGNPAEAVFSPDAVDHDSFTITVRNGSGTTGAARQMADYLTARGFLVEEVGNADVYIYDETLIIYGDRENAAAAVTVQRSLGVGRVIASNGFYSFDTDILVVLGGDWKPLN